MELCNSDRVALMRASLGSDNTSAISALAADNQLNPKSISQR